ncbi:trypsin epsilon-like isoform X2 [Periplaneta americana]|uniref:trypsin epsilon-like isoform X2 n=1 Tax=Periplaneta americana TaxID=6978 RepID=UPI0037E9B10C
MFQGKRQLRGNLRCLQVLLFVVTVSGAHVETPDSRIVGGSETTIEEYPYQLSLQVQPSDEFIHHCGASIIGEKWAISAAHCVYRIPLEKMLLRAGSTYASKGGTLHNVKKIYTNYYNPRINDNDICLIEVEPPFEYSKSVQAIPMESSSVADGTIGVATGWGRVETYGRQSDVLLQVSLPVLNYDTCSDNYFDEGFEDVPHHDQMCTLDDGKGTCQGDSGGPFVVDGKLVGIHSWEPECGQREYPSIFSNMSYFRGWVKDVTGI